MKSLITIFLVFAVTIVLFFSPSLFDQKSILLQELSDLFHIFFFFLLYSFLSLEPYLKNLWKSKFRLIATLTLVAFSIEFIQPFTGRSASIDDFVNGLIGILSGYFFILLWKESKRDFDFFIILFYCLLIASSPVRNSYLAYRSYYLRKDLFPILGEFEDDLELKFWKPTYAQNKELSDVSIQNSILQVKGDSKAGVQYYNEYKDWSKYDKLVINFSLEDRGTVQNNTKYLVNISLYDSESKSEYLNRFNVSTYLSSKNFIEIDLKSLLVSSKKRSLDLRNIDKLVIFRKKCLDKCRFGISMAKLE